MASPTPPAVPVAVGNLPVAIAAADFNGDGRPDLAVVNQNDGNVSSLLGDGTGGFAPAPGSPFPADCGCPSFVGIADLDGDGRLDLAVANLGVDSVTILLGNGTGSFAAAVGSPVPTGGAGPFALVLADVDANGKPDLAVANGFSDDVSVLRNTTCCYLTVSLTGSGDGSVTSSPARIACATACIRAFDPGAAVVLAVTRVPGSRFAGWSGGGCTGRAPCAVPLTTDVMVTASFLPVASTGDFDGDRRADLAVFRPPTSEWFVFGSATGFTGAVPFGAPGDRLVPADYDGDLRTDLAVFRPATAEWFVFGSATGFTGAMPVGAPGDQPVPADYDGDGAADLAVFRPATAEWAIVGSAGGVRDLTPFGMPGDVPVPADYDGDDQADLAVFRPGTGQWFVFGSATGPIGPLAFGTVGDLPIPADYDGDGKADLAVFRPTTAEWFIFGSATGLTTATFGTAGNLPIPADYDGDGRADLAVFRPATAEWFIFGSATGFAGAIPFGAVSLDRPARR